jgi:hypothetical protein
MLNCFRVHPTVAVPARSGKTVTVGGLAPATGGAGAVVHQSPASARSAAALSVCSQVNSGSSRPK